LLLFLVGFQVAIFILAGLVMTALVVTAILMRGDLGKANKKAKFRQMFSHNRAVNILAAARVFLFASRDVWFVVGLPGLSLHCSWLELLAGWRVPGDLGHRLRVCSGIGARGHQAPDAGR